MSTPVFIITPVNDCIEEAVTRGSNNTKDRPAFYTLKTPDGQIYAGSTGAIGTRLNAHKNELKKGKHLYPALQSAVVKEQPIHVAVEYTTNRETAYEVEQAYLSSNVNNPKLLNKSLHARGPMTGRAPNEYTIQRLKETHSGKVVSEKTRQKMSEARLKNLNANKDSDTKQIRFFPKPVIVEGIDYSSINEAGKALDVNPSVVRSRIDSKKHKFLNYSFKK